MAQVDTTYGTYLSNLFNPQVVADLLDTKLTNKMVFAPLARIDRTLEGRAGNTVTMPYYSYIGMASQVSEGYDSPLTRLTQTTTSVTVIKFGKAAQITDEAALSAYGDALDEAATQIVTSLDDAIDNALLAALAANSASEQNYATSGSTVALAPEDIPRALAKFGIALEHLVALDALVVADGDAGAVYETDAGALAEAEQLEEHGHLDCHAGLQLHKAVV